MKAFAVGLGLLVAALWQSPAHAQPPGAESGLRWSLGLAVLSSPRPYVGADNQTRVIPLLEIESGRFYFRGITAGYRLVDEERFSLEVIGRAQLGGYEAKDSAFLAGMEERRATMELGLAASWRFGRFALEGTAAADALGRSDGSQLGLDLTWSKILGRGKGGVFPAIGLVWQSADFVDYYAGVRPAEARPGRPRYEGRAAVNLTGGVRAFYRPAERWTAIGLLRVERLADEFEASPILDDRWGYFGLIGATYRF